MSVLPGGFGIDLPEDKPTWESKTVTNVFPLPVTIEDGKHVAAACQKCGGPIEAKWVCPKCDQPPARRCPKCGGGMKPHYHYMCHPQCVIGRGCHDKEHLHWECACGFWQAEPCLDAKEAGK